MKQIYTLTFLLFLPFFAKSQSREIFFESNGIVNQILDSKVDKDGNIISVGNYGSAYWSLIKTDCKGHIIWSKTQQFDEARTAIIKIAQNGDYLVGGCGPYPMIVRITPNGQIVWRHRVSYGMGTVNGNMTCTGIVELPSGSIVACGRNMYNGYGYAGWLNKYDSFGNILLANSYRDNNDAGAWLLFSSMSYIDTNIVIAGYTGGQNMLHLLDTSGNYIKSYSYAAQTSADGTTVQAGMIDVLEQQNGKFATRISFDNLTPPADTSHKDAIFLGTLNFSTQSITGSILSLKEYPLLNERGIYIQDTNSFYISFTPYRNRTEYAGGQKFYYTAQLDNDTVVYAKKISTDSLLCVNSICVIKDSVISTGIIGSNSYFGFLNKNQNATLNCDIKDTTFALNKLSIQLIPVDYSPYINVYTETLGTGIVWGDILEDMSLSTKYLCGEEPIKVSRLSLDNSAAKIYPNPTNGVLKLENIGRFTSVKLYDITGKVLLTKNIDSSELQIDLGSYKSGYYMLILLSDDIYEMKKIEKM
jgi:hypothetical protein